MISLRSQEVNVDRLNLLQVLKRNLEKHANEYKEAIHNYRLALIVDVQELLDELEKTTLLNSRLVKLKINFVVPQSQEEQYQNVIDMLEASVDENIKLDNEAFQAYYKDNWSWKKGFAELTSLYATKAATYQG